MCMASGAGCWSWAGTPLLLGSALSSLTAWAAPVSASSFLVEECPTEGLLLEVLATSSSSPAALRQKHLKATLRWGLAQSSLLAGGGRGHICRAERSRAWGLGAVQPPAVLAKGLRCKGGMHADDPHFSPSNRNLVGKPCCWGVCGGEAKTLHCEKGMRGMRSSESVSNQDQRSGSAGSAAIP